jgi:hypothetical protein
MLEGGALTRPRRDEPRRRPQRLGLVAEPGLVQRRLGLAHEPVARRLGPAQAERGDEGRLVAAGVLAGAFAEFGLVALGVENVVGDLEGGAQRSAITRQGDARWLRRRGDDRPGLDREGQKRAGLHRLQPKDRVAVKRDR